MSDCVSATVARRARAERGRLERPTGAPTTHEGLRRAVRTVLGWVLLLLSVVHVRPARAEEVQEPWLGIETQGDPCIAADILSAEIERLLHNQRPAGVTVQARTRGEGWIIELQHANGQRAVRAFPELAVDCAERLRVLALATALAVEHAVQAAPVAAKAPRRPGSITRWSVGVSAGASVGELPTPVPVLAAEARLERGAWVPVELVGLVDLRPSHSSLAGGELTTRQATGSLGTCVGQRRRSWRVDGCLAVELGAVLGDAARVPRPQRDTAGSGAANLGVVARWSPRPHLAMTMRIDGFTRFWVPRFQVLDAEGDRLSERRLPLVGGRLRVGLSWLSR